MPASRNVLTEPVTLARPPPPCTCPSNADQWVGLYIEYKFQTPIGTHLPGLANHLARNIMDPAVQKSSIMTNGESGLGSLGVLGQKPLNLFGSQCSSFGKWTEFHLSHTYSYRGATGNQTWDLRWGAG